MRVTKTVKEYIGKCVREKVYKKYEAEKEAADTENMILKNFWDALGEEIENIAKERVEKLLAEYDFIELNNPRYTGSNFTYYYSNKTVIKDSCCNDSKHNWRRRADIEVNEKVSDIIVTLELGGTRADLDRMLSEI